MSDEPVMLFRDRVVRGFMTMEQFARELIRIEGTTRGPCLGPDQGARLPPPREPIAQQAALFDTDANVLEPSEVA